MKTVSRTTPARLVVEVGQPVETLPALQKPGPNDIPPHWATVIDACQQHPNMWIPFTISAFDVNGHRGAAARINRHEMKCLSDPGYQAAYREGKLFIRYATKATSLSSVPDRLLRSNAS